MSRGLPRPPAIPTNSRVEDIIGLNNLDIFFDYVRMWETSAKDGMPPGKREMSKFSPEVIATMPGILAELRANGYYVAGTDGQRVRWGIMLKSESQEMFEQGLHELRGKTQEELQQMARDGYRTINRQTEMPKVQAHEINGERQKW